MTATQKFLSEMGEDKKVLFTPIFESVDNFYNTVYFIVKNEHITDQEKGPQHEERLRIIRNVKERVEKMLDLMGFEGSELIADIASDYFEDYVHYREPDFGFANETFIRIIQRISQ